MFTNKTIKANKNKIKCILIFVCVLGQSVFTSSKSQAQNHVNFEVGGFIAARCAFDQFQNLPLANPTNLSFNINPDQPRSSTPTEKIGLGLTCNAPFTLTVTSNNGGLLNTNPQLKQIGGDFTKQIAYRATVNITTEDTSAPIALTCQSAEMLNRTAACVASSGSNTAIGRGAGIGEIAIALSDSEQSPIQGRYQDTIFLALALQ